MGDPEKLDRRTSRPSASLRTKSGAASPCLSIAPRRPACEIKVAYRLAPASAQTQKRRLAALFHVHLELLLDDAVDGVHEVHLEERARGAQPSAPHPVQQASP